MSDHYGMESVFKKPALPSRYQRTHSYNRADSAMSNTNEYSSITVKEKIEILEKVFPQNDDIWENLVKNIDHLCFVKVSESVLQQNSQRSLINNANACPGISPQHTSSNFRFNYTQSTNNVPDSISQPQPQPQNIISAPVPPEAQYRNSRTRNVCTAPAPARSQEINSRNIVSGFQNTGQRLVKNETFLEVRNSRTRNNSSRANNESTEENDSSLRSESYASNISEENVVPRTRKESAANAGSKINKRRSQGEESSDRGKQKRPKKDDAIKENIQRASSTSAKCQKLVGQKNSHPLKNNLNLSELDDENDSDDSLAAFFQKRRKHLMKPSVVETDSSQSSQDTVIETKPSITRKTKKTSNTQPRETAKSTVAKTRSKPSNEEDSNSEDVTLQPQECSDIQIVNAKKPSKTRTTQVRKTSRAEKVITKGRTTQNSPSCEENSGSDELDVPAREGNRKTKDTRRTVKTTVVRKTQYEEDSVSSDANESQESTIHETKSTKKCADTENRNRMKSVPAKKSESSSSRRRTAAVNQVRGDVAEQKKKTVAPSQVLDAVTRKAGNKVASNSANKQENNVDASFFGNISAILSNRSVSLVYAEKGRKSKSQPTHEVDTSMHFFSPFASANLRSTSGFSAISTPLSKSVAKNVLGKRVKKPNVGAELRNELKEHSKKRKTKKNPYVIQPVPETTPTSESDCEASDFSDMD